MSKKIEKSEAEWQKELSEEVFHVTREKGTEHPFTGKYWDHHENGVYACVCCGEPLFDSNTKFDAGCGWPSFYASMGKEKVVMQADNSLGMHRVEIMCANCGAHLGHIFEDGPEPTGLRYCVNSASLRFDMKNK